MNCATALSKRPPNRIRQARLAAGLTQMEAAVLAGIAGSTLSLAERTGFISLATAERLAAVYKVETKDLLQ